MDFEIVTKHRIDTVIIQSILTDRSGRTESDQGLHYLPMHLHYCMYIQSIIIALFFIFMTHGYTECSDCNPCNSWYKQVHLSYLQLQQ